ncbi:MAG: hypothetical protein I3274_02695 [Candidatus Moeniiplasma glomeromycotorum]|nr:hypothetical protein [Candidatus Moeniiplasma glomeromycotorum]MCE8167513.1 hypothetical protein [Candidatus Moeniiplasma glomeromycotorum]
MLNLTKKSPYSAREIALLLLSFDVHGTYFTNRKLNGFFATNLSMGNFRLNAHLQVAQMLHYAHYQTPLFADKIKAYEHGGYVENIAQEFPVLLASRKKLISLDKKTKQFLAHLFIYLKENYTNRDLETLVCEDIAWGNALEKKTKNTFVYNQEVLNDYRILVNPLWKDMVGTN